MSKYYEKIRDFIHAVGLSADTEPWKRNLAFISIAQFFTMMGMSSVIPFMPIYVQQLGVTDLQEAKLWSGLIFAGPFFLSLIFSPIWGSLGDRYGRKPMIIRATLGLSLAVMLMGFVDNVYQLFALRIIQGAVSGMIAAALAFISANTPEKQSGFAIAILQGSLSAGTIVGPFIGGIISDLVGIRPVFWLVSAFCFTSGVLIFFFVHERFTRPARTRGSAILKNLRYIKNKKILVSIMILIVLSQAGLQFPNPIMPFFVEELGAPQKYLSSITGSLFAIVAAMSILFASKWGKRSDRKDFRKTLRVSASVIGLATLSQIIVPNFYFLYPLRAMIGIFYSAMIPTLYSAISKRVPMESKGGIMGLASSANTLGTASSYVLCGIVASRISLQATFIFSAILLCLVVISTMLIKD